MALKDETDQTRMRPMVTEGTTGWPTAWRRCLGGRRAGRAGRPRARLAAIVLVAAVLLVAGSGELPDRHAAGRPRPVDLVVSHCIALMGGSGSNAAGYECTGTYTFHGQRYTEGVPGSALYESGATVHGIVAASDPGLFSTTGRWTVSGRRRSGCCCRRWCSW